MRTPTIGVGRGRRLLGLLSAFVVLFAAIVPLTARAQEPGDEICYDEVVEQLWERQAYQKQTRERHQEWRWLREHKDIKGWQHVNGSWVEGNPDVWYTVPGTVIAAANFDPRGLLGPGQTQASGSVNLNVYGGPNRTVQYVFEIQGPSAFTTSETSPYGTGSIKVDSRLSDWSTWTNVGEPFFAVSPPAVSNTNTLQTQYVVSGSPEQVWLPEGQQPEGDGWRMIENQTRTVDVDRDCLAPRWLCDDDGKVVQVTERDERFVGAYSTPGEAAEDSRCQEVAAATTFTIGGSCDVVEDLAEFAISGNLGEGLTLEVAGETIEASGPFSVSVTAGDFDYTVTVDEGFVLAEGSPPAEGTISIDDCTPPPPPPSGWVCVDGSVEFIEDATGFEGTLYETEDAAADDADCRDEVLASIIVTVDGGCDDEDGAIDVTVSVADGATVVIRNSNGAVVATLSDDGVVEVADDATYTWTATPNEGFSFPPGSAQSGTVVIDECSDDEVEAEELPFTGVDLDVLAIVSTVLIGAGAMTLFSQRRREES